MNIVEIFLKNKKKIEPKNKIKILEEFHTKKLQQLEICDNVKFFNFDVFVGRCCRRDFWSRVQFGQMPPVSGGSELRR